MLLELFLWLAETNSDFSVFGYITLRGILGALTALAISLVLGPTFIRRLVKKQVSQEYLWLLALKHNMEPFAHGKRQGHSPFEMLGIDLGTNDWIDLLKTYQP